MDNPFRLPGDMKPKKDKVPLSTRVFAETKDLLEKAAKEQGLALSELVGNIVDDYAAWLRAKKKR